MLLRDHRQIQKAVPLVQRPLQRRQVNPQVVGVEQPVASDILKLPDLLRRALGDFPQQEPSIRSLGQMAPLAVGRGAARHLHQKGQVLGSEKTQNVRLDCRAQIVGVADEHVFVAESEHLFQQLAAMQRQVHVPVTGRAPLLCRVFMPFDRGETVLADLRHFVLQEPQGQIAGQFRVGRQRLVGSLLRAVAVHKDKGQPGHRLLANVQDMADDDIQKAQPVFHHEQGSRPIQPHTGAESTVQLDDDQPLQRV